MTIRSVASCQASFASLSTFSLTFNICWLSLILIYEHGPSNVRYPENVLLMASSGPAGYFQMLVLSNSSGLKCHLKSRRTIWTVNNSVNTGRFGLLSFVICIEVKSHATACLWRPWSICSLLLEEISPRKMYKKHRESHGIRTSTDGAPVQSTTE